MPEQKQEDPGKAMREKSAQEFAERTKGKPTPTQEENDRTARGEHIAKHEPDGSPEVDEQRLTPSGHRAEQPQQNKTQPHK